MRPVLIALCTLAVAIGVTGSNEGPARWDTGILWPGNAAEEPGGPARQETAARVEVRAAIAAARELRLDDFIAEWKAKVAAEPDSALARFALAYAYLIHESPDYIKASAAAGGLWNNIDTAIRLLDKAIEIDPSLGQARLVLGYVYAQFSPNPVKAIAVLGELLKREPGNAEAMYWMAKAYGWDTPDERFKHEHCYHPLKRIQWLESAKAICPNWLRVRRALGTAYWAQGWDRTARKWHLDEPWKTKAVAEYRAVLELARQQRDASLVERVSRRLAELGAG